MRSYGSMDERLEAQTLNQHCVIDGCTVFCGTVFQGLLHLPAIMMHGQHEFTGPSNSPEIFMTESPTVCVFVFDWGR